MMSLLSVMRIDKYLPIHPSLLALLILRYTIERIEVWTLVDMLYVFCRGEPDGRCVHLSTVRHFSYAPRQKIISIGEGVQCHTNGEVEPWFCLSDS